jgi:hypothetical protein
MNGEMSVLWKFVAHFRVSDDLRQAPAKPALRVVASW